MDYKFIDYQVRDKIAWLKFNRPDQLNAMNRLMMDEIIDALNSSDQSLGHEVRVGVITGEGKAFMAGADIKEYAQQTQEQFEDFQTRGRALYSAIENNSKPIIAAVNGYAFGGGLEIALACDMMVAVEGAKMGLPEIHLNLIPGGGGTQRLPRKIGINLANEMIMTGRTVQAEEMHQHGLINRLFQARTFDEDLKEFAQQFTNKEPDRLEAIKKLIQMSVAQSEDQVLEFEISALTSFYLSDEGQAKVQEFYRKSQEKKK